ncbi:nucleotidyltransferase domain-containing protein [Methylomicrobium sp. RS1]|jgi:hypothetical protein|uniref:nucleotidyltransferase domain-containing protein n=1 Tax=Candidatus Methylomicrobium oryzae TaxID=2802053 RepID=UPI001924C38C|nr:nucleotidyltransferase family protein [Methylomicrobium sp. RS1]MBL1264968.1 nucleotidyltransferase family protein [Methylomicrobium sp. RS1]
MTPPLSSLVELFRQPSLLPQLTDIDWDIIVPQARRALLLGRLYWLVKRHEASAAVPANVLRHLESGFIDAAKQKRDLHWEIRKLQTIFRELDIPLLLLKGSGYVIADLLASNGRTFSDIDILVPKKDIDRVEKALMFHGWFAAEKDPYNQRYYRQWMHEIPPLHHIKRGSVVDLHHNILPLTAKDCPDANKLLADARPLDNHPNIKILNCYDIIIHSATHLFYEGELEHGLRDISDLDLLFREFSAQDDFWQRLISRAEELNLQRQIFYGMRYTHRLLNTPVPVDVLQAFESVGFGKRWQIRLMDFLFLRALLPDHPSCADRWTGLARWLLYVRSHWLRMKWYLLIPHLLRKSYYRLSGKHDH